jgi:thioredoxin reductase (NADPH)
MGQEPQAQPEWRREARPDYDVIVVGAGAAGLAAAIESAAEGMRTLLVEREAIAGGRLCQTGRIGLLDGLPVGLSGSEFAERAAARAQKFGVELTTGREAVELYSDGSFPSIRFADGSIFSSHTVIVATGSDSAFPDVPGLLEFEGAGVYTYEPVVPIEWLRDRDIVVIGTPDRALQYAQKRLAQSHSVTVVLNGSLPKEWEKPGQQGDLPSTLTILAHTELVSVIGVDHLEVVVLRDSLQKLNIIRPAAALFLLLDHTPRTAWLGDAIELDNTGSVRTRWIAESPEEVMPGDAPAGIFETSLSGVFAAGDVRGSAQRSFQVIVDEGIMAARQAYAHVVTSTVRREAARINTKSTTH